MALSKPVIATSGGGTPELVEESINGFIIPPYNPTELEKKIVYLLDNEDLRKSMGKASFLITCNKFNIDRMGKEFFNAYDRLR
jgi:glycosyltransferase involved in cell wall biosynthesis